MTICDQAAGVQAVIGDGSADTSGQWFDATTTSQVHALDATIFAEVYQHGSYVRVKPEKGNLWYIFSSSNAQVVSSALSPSATGTKSSQLGGPVKAGQEAHLFVPNEYPYFARISDTDDCEVMIEVG